MAQTFCPQPLSVQCPRKHAEAPMAALGRLLTEALVKIQKLIKGRAAHYIHNALIVVRTLLCVAVGSLLAQLVGQIAAADKNHPPFELVRSLLNHLSKAVMLRKRQS